MKNDSWLNMKEQLVNFVLKAYENKPDVDDLGDYLPFMAYFGELDFCRDQISRVESDLLKPVRPERRSDTVLGLIEYYRLTKDDEALELAEKYVDSLFGNFFQDGWIYSRSRGGFLRLKKPINGLYIELLTDLYELSTDRHFLDEAKVLADNWIRDPFFRRYSLFRANQYLDRVSLFKDNTSVVNGLISLCEITGEEEFETAVFQWLRSVMRRCVDESGVRGLLDLTKQSLVSSAYSLASRLSRVVLRPRDPHAESLVEDSYSLRFSFPLVDVACYAYYVFREQSLLDLARRICDFWIPRQSSIGLFPITSTQGVKETIMDSITDFSISLWALYELSGVDRYKQSAVRAVEGLFRHHYPYLKVNCETGEVLDRTICKKYIGLLLKMPILLKEGGIFSRKEIFKLLRDR